jgi:hypothetical protein
MSSTSETNFYAKIGQLAVDGDFLQKEVQTTRTVRERVELVEKSSLTEHEKIM